MKNITFLFFLFLIFSCSSDNSDNEITPIKPFVESFEMSVNGEAFTYDANLYRIEDTFTIGFGSNQLLSFNKFGNFGDFFVDLRLDSPTKTSKFYSYVNFSSNYFTFKIDELDEINKTVNGSFSGYLVSDKLNLNSEKKFVNGSFAKKYQDVAPLISNLKNSAKINGNPWIQTNEYLTKEINNTLIIRNTVSDDPYKIMIKYIEDDINIGTFNFSELTPTITIQLAKFDTATQQYVTYISTGTLKVLQKEPLISNGNTFILRGTYEFTAVNPNNFDDVITVTEGSFKVYNTYFP